MNNTIKIFEKEYDGESMCDVSRDVNEAFDKNFNDLVDEIPSDEYGFLDGRFKVSIVWEADCKDEEEK